MENNNILNNNNYDHNNKQTNIFFDDESIHNQLNLNKRVSKLILKSTKITKKSIIHSNLPLISNNSPNRPVRNSLNTESLAQSEYSKWSNLIDHSPNKSRNSFKSINGHNINNNNNNLSDISLNHSTRSMTSHGGKHKSISGYRHLQNELKNEINVDSLNNLKDLLNSLDNEKSKRLLHTSNEKLYSHISTPVLSKQPSINSIISDKFYSSIHNIPSNDLITMNSLISAYDKELSSYDSMALFVEVRLRELLMNESANTVHPTRLKAAVCSDLLLKVCDNMGRYSNVIRPLVHELLNSIYVNYSLNEIKNSPKNTTNNNVKRFYDMNTYFNELEKSKDYASDLSEELLMINKGVKMKEVVKKFETFTILHDHARYYIRTCAFYSWKKYTKTRSIIRQKVYKQSLKSYWRRWILYIIMTRGEISYSKYTGINMKFLVGLLEKAVENSRALIEKSILIKIKASQSLNEFDEEIMIDTHQYKSDDVSPISQMIDKKIKDLVVNNKNKDKDHPVKTVDFKFE